MTPSMKAMREEALRIIGEAVGEASLCWDPPPGPQVFDSDRASKIVEETAKKLKVAKAKIHIEGRKNYCRGCGKPDHRGLCDACAFPKKASVGGYAAKAGKFIRSLPTAVPRNVGNTLKDFRTPLKSMKAGWHADNRLGRAMTVGFAGMDARDAIKKQDPTGRNRGRAERVGAAIGNTAGGLIGLRHGIMSGGLAGSALGSYAGGRVGRIADGAMKVVRRPSTPKPMVPVEAR